jgi:hypothetical protein
VRPGRAALAVMPDGTAASVQAFLDDRIRPGSAVWTDAWSSYLGLSPRGFSPAAIPLGRGPEAVGRFFPWVHIALSNLKRFLLETHHRPQAKHLSWYVAKFAYRLNRRWQEADLFEQLARVLSDHQHNHLQRLSGVAGANVTITCLRTTRECPVESASKLTRVLFHALIRWGLR